MQVAKSIVATAPGTAFDVRVTDLSNSYAQRPKSMKVSKCTPVPSMWLVPTVEKDELDNVNAVQIYKALKSKPEIMDEHYDTTQQDAPFQDKHWRGTEQLNKEFSVFKQPFMEMMERFESMWDCHPGRITVSKHRIVLNSLDAPPIHSTPYRAGPKQRELKRKEVDKMQKAGVAEPAMTEWALPIVLVSKKDGSLHFSVDYLRQNAVTDHDSYPT